MLVLGPLRLTQPTVSHHILQKTENALNNTFAVFDNLSNYDYDAL